MKYFLPDSKDRVDPTFDFTLETRSPDRLPRDDLYAHEIVARPYDGILVSYAMLRNGTYPAATSRRLLRSGLREFYRAPSWMTFMGDCGAFSYVKDESPPYEVSEVAEFYAAVGVDFGVAVDHIVPGYADNADPPSDEARYRYDLTLELAVDFIGASKRYAYTPVGAVHGWSPESYAASAATLQRMGYRYLAIGGLVPLRTDQLMCVLAAVSGVRLPGTKLHLLGMARRGMHRQFADFGVASIDSTSPLRQAWMDARKNYHIGGETFVALRVPDSNSTRVRKRIASGEVDQTDLRVREAAAMDAVDRYAKHQTSASETLDYILNYQDMHSPGENRQREYLRTLDARPWELCKCSICATIGHHVILFRGAERNRRRGLHNVHEFYRGMLRELGEPDLVLVGCGSAKRKTPCRALDIYTGSVFRASVKIASRYRAPMRILSAEHGLLDPEQVIDWYDKTKPDAEWGRRVVAQLRETITAGSRVVALAGSDYLGWVDNLDDITVEMPLAGKTLGERLAIAAGTDQTPERPARAGKLIAWDFFYTTNRSSLRDRQAFDEHWQREGARHVRLELPEDTPLHEAILAARETGAFGKGTPRTGVFEVQNDHGIYWAPDGYLNLGLAKPQRVRFITWGEAERAETNGLDHIDDPSRFPTIDRVA